MKRFGSFGLDSKNECLWQDGTQIPLAPKPFAVLRYLVEHPNRLITHDELLDALWPETYVQPQVLRTYMLELRKALGDDARQPLFIQSIPKRGYRFVAAVTECVETEPRQSIKAPSANIAGRDAELSALEFHLHRAQDGQRQFVWLTGDSGIGKTALIEAFCNSLDVASGSMLARGQCVQGLAEKEQYYPVMEAMTELCASPHAEAACAVLLRLAPAWMARLGRNAAGNHSSPSSREAGDLCAALEELAAERPLILVLEDLHWADASSLDFLSALARRRAPAQLLILASFNPQHAPASHPVRQLKQDLCMRKHASDLALSPLRRDAVRQMLCSALGQQELPPDLDNFVFRHAEGNPLCVVAILEHLIAERFLVRSDVDGKPLWQQRAPLDTLHTGVPDKLAQMIELEIQRLTPDEQRLLEAGSLTSVVFPAWAVAAALEQDLLETESACDDLANRLHFFRRAGHDELPDGTRSNFYVFVHGLYREVLYQRQSAGRRAQWHNRIAERLSQLFAGREIHVASELAMHFEAAGNWMRAILPLRAAAFIAQQRGSHAAATELLERALRIAANLPHDEKAGIVRVLEEERDASAEALSRPGDDQNQALENFDVF